MKIESAIQIHAIGTSEGVTKAWETRGRGRALMDNGEKATYLHKGLHETLTGKLGYKFNGTFGEKKAGTNESHYISPKGRVISVSEGGQWRSHHESQPFVSEKGSTPSDYISKYHMRKK